MRYLYYNIDRYTGQDWRLLGHFPAYCYFTGGDFTGNDCWEKCHFITKKKTKNCKPTVMLRNNDNSSFLVIYKDDCDNTLCENMYMIQNTRPMEDITYICRLTFTFLSSSRSNFRDINWPLTMFRSYYDLEP